MSKMHSYPIGTIVEFDGEPPRKIVGMKQETWGGRNVVLYELDYDETTYITDGLLREEIEIGRATVTEVPDA